MRVTKDELIEQLQETDLPGYTNVYLCTDEDGTYVESDEVVVTKVGSINNPKTVIALY